VSIIVSEPAAIGAVETVDTIKPAVVPVAVFIIVEIMLVAETISVLLLKVVDLRNPSAAPIAILLSVALLANLGVICNTAAAIAANSVRQSKGEPARAISGWFAPVGASAGGDRVRDGDFAGVDVAAPASSVFPPFGPAGVPDAEDRGVEVVVRSRPGDDEGACPVSRTPVMPTSG
jgi:hypothetical protein